MKLPKNIQNKFFTIVVVLTIIFAGGAQAEAENSSNARSNTLSICQSTNDNSTKKPALTLTGEIGHADELKPIEPMLQAGSKFDNRILKVFKPQDYWYQIPNWLGGIWQRNEQNLLKQKSLTLTDKIKSSLYPPRLGKFKSQVKYRWGYQYDRVGNIWNYAKFPYIVKVDGANSYTIQVVREATPLSVSDKVVTLKFRSTSHKIDARTNMIMFAEQAEAISMFAKYEPNTLYVRYSRKVFDSKGKPRSIQESDSFIPRVSKFFPVNNLKGKDLRTSLANYLSVHNPSLVPSVVLPKNGMQAIRPFQATPNYILVPTDQNTNYQYRLNNRMNPNLNQAYPNMLRQPVYQNQQILNHYNYQQGNLNPGPNPVNRPAPQFRQPVWNPLQLKLHQEQYRNKRQRTQKREKETSPVPQSHQPPEVKLNENQKNEPSETKEEAKSKDDSKNKTKPAKTDEN